MVGSGVRKSLQALIVGIIAFEEHDVAIERHGVKYDGEACASSHHWARELSALGHTVKLMPPAYVKPFVKRQKNDAADAEAICEAVQRPSMRFVPVKTPDQQAAMVLHRTRHLYVRQMTAVINALRAHLAEFGIVAPQGRNGVEQLVAVIKDSKDDRIPELVRTCLTALSIQLGAIKQQIAILDRRLIGLHRTSETSKRLDAIPGVGPALATALVASVADPNPRDQTFVRAVMENLTDSDARMIPGFGPGQGIVSGQVVRFPLAVKVDMDTELRLAEIGDEDFFEQLGEWEPDEDAGTRDDIAASMQGVKKKRRKQD